LTTCPPTSTRRVRAGLSAAGCPWPLFSSAWDAK